jgi:conjugative transfer signal peptidase TraF
LFEVPYRVSPPQRFAVTDLVVAKPTEPLATILAEGGYLPRGLPLIKRVLALPGQTVCRTGVFVTVDGIVMGSAREKDRNGRKLPEWQGCRVVAPEHVFLMNWDEPSSFDGRYFGMLPISAVLGRAEPIWTSEED